MKLHTKLKFYIPILVGFLGLISQFSVIRADSIGILTLYSGAGGLEVKPDSSRLTGNALQSNNYKYQFKRLPMSDVAPYIELNDPASPNFLLRSYQVMYFQFGGYLNTTYHSLTSYNCTMWVYLYHSGGTHYILVETGVSNNHIYVDYYSTEFSEKIYHYDSPYPNASYLEVNMQIYTGTNGINFGTWIKCAFRYDKNDSQVFTSPLGGYSNTANDAMQLMSYSGVSHHGGIDLVEQQIYTGCYSGLESVRLLCYYGQYPTEFTLLTDFISNAINVVPSVPITPPPGEITSTYWEYPQYSLENDYQEIVYPIPEDNNYNYSFNFLKGKEETGRYYYTTEAIPLIVPESWGDWQIICCGDSNWLRNGLCTIINVFILILNAILLVFQFIGFLLVAAFEILIMYVSCMWIVPFLNNILLYWIIFGLAFIWYWLLWILINGLDVIITFLIFVWETIILPILVLIYETIIVPITNWFVNVALPLIIDIVIMVFSVIITCFIYLLSFGTIDFATTLTNVIGFNEYVLTFLVDSIGIFFENFLQVLEYATIYLLMLGFTYLKLIFCKAKGYVNRSTQIETMYQAILIPFNLLKKIGLWFKDLIAGWI